MQFPGVSRASSITLLIANILWALFTGSDFRPARKSPMVFCANFSASEPGWAVPRRQNKTIIQPQIPVISIPHSVQCNVVYATKETLTICYLDLYCIKMDNISKIAELSVVMNAGLVELLVASVPQPDWLLPAWRLLPGWYTTRTLHSTEHRNSNCAIARIEKEVHLYRL